MKALTIWQPWATLIIEGAKPFEFRRWAYTDRYGFLNGTRIAIHAGARPMRTDEVYDILDRIEEGTSALKADLARDILERALAANAMHAGDRTKKIMRAVLPLSSVLGTAVIGNPKRATELFAGVIDSDRLDHSMWAWPLTDIRRFEPPVDYRGAQGFWNFPEALAA